MENSASQLNPTSNGQDFQPTTNNPQGTVGGGVQPTTATVQPVQAGSNGMTAEQLYQQAERQANLTVETDNYSANSLVSVQPEPPRSNSGLISVTGAALILLLVVIVARRYWQVLPSVTLEDEPVSELAAVPEAEVSEPKPAPAKKKPAKKKSAAKKKKRSVKKK